MLTEMTQKQVLEKSIEFARALLESTRNPDAQAKIEQALMYLGNIRGELNGDGIPEYDPVMLFTVSGKIVKVYK